MKLEKAIIQKLEKDLETVKTMGDLLGKNGVIKKLVKHLTIAAVTGRADSPSGV